MNTKVNIITVRRCDINKADECFAKFMSMLESEFNIKAAKTPGLYKDSGGKKMEEVTVKLMREIAPSTPFRPEEIKLISGARFPDITAETFYGVEVKTTLSDVWKSTGSSIVESTRLDKVENIYMLFAKLGGDIAEFRCRQYQKCLSDISVTHSPRYRIDMELKDSESIFDKLNVDYEDFRKLDTEDKISCVRKYYKDEAKKNERTEMPWWLEEDTSPTVRLFNELSHEEKAFFKSKLLILFPEIVSRDRDKYKRAVLYLCSRYALVSHNFRDQFTASGMINNIGGKVLSKPLPHVIDVILNLKNGIKMMLKNPDASFVMDIQEMWNENINKDFYKRWCEKVISYLIHEERNIPSRKDGITLYDIFK